MKDYETKDGDISKVQLKLFNIRKMFREEPTVVKEFPCVEMVWVFFADGTVIEPTKAEIIDNAGILDIKFKAFQRVSQTDVLFRVRDLPMRLDRKFWKGE